MYQTKTTTTGIEQRRREDAKEPPIRKYIVCEDERGKEHIIIGDQGVEHARMVPQKSGMIVLSAGFFCIYDGCLVVPGNIPSTTLNIGPAPCDQDRLKAFLCLH